MSSNIQNATPNPIVDLELDGHGGARPGRADDRPPRRPRPHAGPQAHGRAVPGAGGEPAGHAHRRAGRRGARPVARRARRRRGRRSTSSATSRTRCRSRSSPSGSACRRRANPQFREWTSWVARSRDPMPPDERDEFYVALDAMHDYLEEQAEAKRQAPAGDLLTYLVHPDDDGDCLLGEELMAQLITLYMAGHEPTAGLVANGILGLLAPARPARPAAGRAGAAPQRGLRAAPLRRPEPVHPADHHPAADSATATSRSRPAPCSTSGSRRPTATRAAGATPPTRSSSTDPTPTSTCSSAAARTSASARTSPGCRPSASSARSSPGSTAWSSPASRCGAPACSSGLSSLPVRCTIAPREVA